MLKLPRRVISQTNPKRSWNPPPLPPGSDLWPDEPLWLCGWWVCFIPSNPSPNYARPKCLPFESRAQIRICKRRIRGFAHICCRARKLPYDLFILLESRYRPSPYSLICLIFLFGKKICHIYYMRRGTEQVKHLTWNWRVLDCVFIYLRRS